MIEIKSSKEKGTTVKVESETPWTLPNEAAVVIEELVGQAAELLCSNSTQTFAMISTQVQMMIKIKEGK